MADIGFIHRVDDIFTLQDAARVLGISPSTLRHQARAGRMRARLIGKTWVATRDEIERYRCANLGRPGRPAPIDPNLVRTYHAFGPVAGRTPAWLMAYDQERFVIDPGGGNQAPITWKGEPVIEPIATREKAAPTQASFDALTREQVEAALGLDLDAARQVYVDFPEPAVVFRAGPVWNAERFDRWQTVAQMRAPGDGIGRSSQVKRSGHVPRMSALRRARALPRYGLMRLAPFGGFSPQWLPRERVLWAKENPSSPTRRPDRSGQSNRHPTRVRPVRHARRFRAV